MFTTWHEFLLTVRKGCPEVSMTRPSACANWHRQKTSVIIHRICDRKRPTAAANKPWRRLCDRHCSPTWPRQLPNSAGSSRVLAACCRTPPSTAEEAMGGGLPRAAHHTGGPFLCHCEVDWPFEPSDIPKWTETIKWYLTGSHREVSFHWCSTAGKTELCYRYMRAPLELIGTADKYQLLLQVRCSTADFRTSTLFAWKLTKLFVIRAHTIVLNPRPNPNAKRHISVNEKTRGNS